MEGPGPELDPRAGTRRVFLRAGEVPGLVSGVLRGEPACLRRVIGARKGGRYGLALAAAGIVVGVPLRWIPLVAGLGLVAAALGSRFEREAHGLGLRQYLRLSLWMLAPLLLLAAPLRLMQPDALAPGIAAVIVGHALLWRALRRGLG